MEIAKEGKGGGKSNVGAYAWKREELISSLSGSLDVVIDTSKNYLVGNELQKPASGTSFEITNPETISASGFGSGDTRFSGKYFQRVGSVFIYKADSSGGKFNSTFDLSQYAQEVRSEFTAAGYVVDDDSGKYASGQTVDGYRYTTVS